MKYKLKTFTGYIQTVDEGLINAWYDDYCVSGDIPLVNNGDEPYDADGKALALDRHGLIELVME